MVDKSTIIIIIIVAVFGTSAGLSYSGVIPQIFNTGSVANNTNSELREFIQVYLSNIENDTKQTAIEIAAAKATLESQQETLRSQVESLKNQEEMLVNQQLAVIQAAKLLNETKNIATDTLKISQEHKEAALLHNELQKKGDVLIKNISNLTALTYDLLQQHIANNTTIGGMNYTKYGNR